ncbi:aminoacyl--tRNA ligase-related protein [Candidatus Vidania fulgoroideorum]
MRTSSLYIVFDKNENFGGFQIEKGFFFHTPFNVVLIDKIVKLIEKELKKNLYFKVIAPSLQKNIFKKSVFKTEFGLALNPTCEEIFIKFIDKYFFTSNKNIFLFQTSSKFRNEKRVEGIIKSREFIMNDAYSFCKKRKICLENFKKTLRIYRRIFNKLGVKFKEVKKKTRSIKSKKTIEFITTINNKNIEIAHCFNIGKEYLTKSYMNCFGIGVTRLCSIMINKLILEKKNILKIVKKRYVIIPTNNNKRLIKYSNKIYKLVKNSILDDRNINFKEKINDFKKINSEIIIISEFCVNNNVITLLKNNKKLDICIKNL